jgi:hypothetical protein
MTKKKIARWLPMTKPKISKPKPLVVRGFKVAHIHQYAIGGGACITINVGAVNEPRDARRLAAWLIKAAAYIEQENR